MKSSLRLMRKLRHAARSEPRARERPPRATPQACLRIKWNPRKRQAQARKVDSLPVILFTKTALASSPRPDVHPSPINNVVWRTGRAALLVRDKESGLIQESPTVRNIVTQLRAGRPQQRSYASDVRCRHRRVTKTCILSIGTVV